LGTAEQTQGQTLIADTSALKDDDGIPTAPDTFSYQWQVSANNKDWSNITNDPTASSTSKQFTLTQGQVGQYVRVEVSYKDGGGTQETFDSLVSRPIVNIDDPATGSVTISSNTGTFKVGSRLTVSNNLVDLDVIVNGSVYYKWQVSSDGATW